MKPSPFAPASASPPVDLRFMYFIRFFHCLQLENGFVKIEMDVLNVIENGMHA